MMTSFTLALTILAVVGSTIAYDNDEYRRPIRASAGSYSGSINGQNYGGTFHAPDNGPAIINRFGDHPSGFSGGFPPTYAPQFPFAPGIPPFPNPIEFNQFFQSYFKALNNNLALYGNPYETNQLGYYWPNDSNKKKTPHSSSSSSASFSYSNPAKENSGAFAKNLAHQQAAFEAAQKAFQATAANRFGSYNGFQYGGFNGGNGGAASASASFGPGGGYQSASIYPHNPSSPNVHTRFGSDGPKPGGQYGVSSSSFSSSSDLNGKKTNYKEASTTVNDNGRITTHTVRS